VSDILAPYLLLADLLDAVPTVLFCLKDVDGRYLSVNHAFVDRTNASARRDVIGHRAHELFPAELAERYEAQDAEILGTVQPLRDELELITRRDGRVGWFLTTKLPVVDGRGRCLAIATVSVDLDAAEDADGDVAALAKVVRFVHATLAQPVSVDQLSGEAGLSTDQLERRMRRVFGLSPKQFVVKARVEEAARLLASTDHALADIAVSCGWYDQSAFTRQFTRVVGCTPGEYRAGKRAPQS
jgi:PAS domain S-box-containing protein